MLCSATDSSRRRSGCSRFNCCGCRHKVGFANLVRGFEIGRDWPATGPLPKGGSGETLDRGWCNVDDPFGVTHSAAQQTAVDFRESDKVRAVLTGSNSGRMFHAHQQDRIEAYMSGEPLHWWFSEAAIEEHAVSRLTLRPKAASPSQYPRPQPETSRFGRSVDRLGNAQPQFCE